MQLDDATVSSLRRENDDLRRRLAEMERRLAAREATSAAAEAQAGGRSAAPVSAGPGGDGPEPASGQAELDGGGMLSAILDNAPMYIYAKDREGRYLLFNRRCQEIARCSFEDVRGKSDYELNPRDVADAYSQADREVLATGKPMSVEEAVPTGAETLHVLSVKFPIMDAAGRVAGVCGISTDVTEQRRAEQENQRLQQEMLRMQESMLRVLSTPLIPIARGVLVMPLVGDVDGRRAEQVLEALLDGVASSSARVAILDVTGVPSVGPEVADGLVRVAKAVGLLGAEVVLTGIPPRMARALVEMGEGLSGLVTRSTLESGIAYAMSRIGR
ncbi:PAS domain-containing protein [Sorangium sp. So ce1182]|uniref:PAS domain-containing protein n=1 Tax=Sorangium sp. So ce1182 TaxID=3133334 RepID=UPI003F64498C